MRRQLPSLNALKAFEAAARHESFTKAALELCVTQGAVSQQVRALEAELGFKLFNRKRQGLSITDTGRDYLGVIRDAFDRIAIGTARIAHQHTSNVLTVSTSPDFAAKWLVHRLGRFAERHPDIDLRVIASLHHVDFAAEDVDMAVRHGTGDWASMDAVQLCRETIFPVCSPGLLRSRRVAIPAADVLKYPLLHLTDRSGWSKWLRYAKAKYVAPLNGLIMNRDSMVIDAACNGMGFALTRASLASRDLLEGRILAPCHPVLPSGASYWIICPQANVTSPKIAAFRSWLLSEAAQDKSLVTALLGRDVFE